MLPGEMERDALIIGEDGDFEPPSDSPVDRAAGDGR
jgi:hypothetical protein